MTTLLYQDPGSYAPLLDILLWGIAGLIGLAGLVFWWLRRRR